MSPTELRDRLVGIFPALATEFSTSLFREPDGTLPFCGILAECSHYVRDHIDELLPYQLGRLGTLVSESMIVRGTELDEAAATCFLENLAFERGAEKLTPFLSGNAASFLEQFGAAERRLQGSWDRASFHSSG
ncbi:hypothetical protein [Alienimonas californiensis]|uniref:hypothetical protein n=1 Tax=Alienimonas californiensis TaxID=2527989 RepID=UPI001A992EE9|nr:hypothetical protein [Alienimonas californiensis]